MLQLQQWGLPKICWLIFPLWKFPFLVKVCQIYWITFIFDMCWLAAVATLVEHVCDILEVAIVLIILNYWENNGNEISLFSTPHNWTVELRYSINSLRQREAYMHQWKFSFLKMHPKMLSVKWRPFCPGVYTYWNLNILRYDQNGYQLAYIIFKNIFLKENCTNFS